MLWFISFYLTILNKIKFLKKEAKNSHTTTILNG